MTKNRFASRRSSLSPLFVGLLAGGLAMASVESYAADGVFTSANKTKITVHEATIPVMALNSEGNAQTSFVATYRYSDGTSSRLEHVVTCAKDGGRIGFLADDGSVSEKQMFWLVTGDSISDSMGLYSCLVAGRKLKAAAAKTKNEITM